MSMGQPLRPPPPPSPRPPTMTTPRGGTQPPLKRGRDPQKCEVQLWLISNSKTRKWRDVCLSPLCKFTCVQYSSEVLTYYYVLIGLSFYNIKWLWYYSVNSNFLFSVLFSYRYMFWKILYVHCSYWVYKFPPFQNEIYITF